ncbi:hypothetical protein GWP40_06080 [Treponema vincentii]|uniref:InlB B-repeat-containing protein n=1 Tax=Treponema vincentii TaxID=69710 RepID=UPI001BAEC1BD|nr:InlB B-repeat-containing protein [Treponema vincentii]QUY17952.1 hypothetical protein GWP40_06080 [Treponema vincentii]
MRKFYAILTGILFTLLFASCNQFTANIDDYLSYWASEAYITDSSIKAVLQNDLNSIPSVPSAEDVSVTFKLKNPKSFSLDLPPAAAPAKKVVVFEHLTQAPVAGTDYTLTQSEDRQSLTLTYKASFLKAHEWGAQDLSSTLSLYAADGRLFKQTYTLKLKANTPPQNPSFTVAKTTGSPAYYVLCIKVPDMDKRVPGGLLHKDLARIEVNGTPYTFSANEAQTAFTKPEADVFITHSDAEKLNEPDADDVPADSSWVLYYKTDVEVKDGAAKKDYTIKLIDERGLASDILNASTKPNKAEAENITITKGTKISGSGSEADPIIIGTGSAGAELTASSPTANTTVHCTLTDTGSSTPIKYDGNPVTVPLPLNGAGEKKYKLEYYTDGTDFAATPVRTVYYKVVQGHTVSFDANGGVYPDGTTAVSKIALHGATVSAPDPRPKKQGFGVTGWYKDKACSAGQAWNFATDMVTGDMTLYAQWTAGADTPYKVKHYQQNVNDNNYPAEPTDTDDNATGTTGANAAVTLKSYPGFEFDKLEPASPTIAADGSTVVKVYYKRKTVHLTFNPNGGKIDGSTDNKTVSGKYGATLTAPTAQKTGYTFNSWKPEGSAPALTLTFPAADATYTAQWTANTYKVHFDKNDNAATGTMADQLFTYDDTTKALTKNKFIKSGHTFDGWATSADGSTFYADEAQVTNLATAQDAIVTLYAKWKKARYNVTYRVEIVDDKAGGKIKADSGSFVENGSTSVEDGGSVGFTADPTNTDWEVAEWKKGNIVVNGTNSTYTLSNVTADTTVTVKFYQSHIKNPATWKDLARAVKSAPDNATLTIDGEIKATSDTGNNGEIVINKNLTIKRATGASSAVIDANNSTGGKPKHRIFKVESNKTLTLENLTLKNGMAEGSDGPGDGGAIYVHGASVKITGCTLTDNTANKNGGAVYATKRDDNAAHVTISGGSINGNTVTDDYGFGGGIYINDGCELTLKGNVTVKGNKAARGGGVRANKSTVTMNSCTFEGNESTHGDASNGCGGVYVHGATVSMQSCTLKSNKGNVRAGGLLVEGGAKVTMDGCTLTGNTATTGGGIYITGGSSIVTLNNGVQIKDNTATTGGGVYVQDGTFKMSGSAIVTPSTGSEANDKGKNDVYLKTGKTITVDGILSHAHAARITPESYRATTVLTGNITGGSPENRKKFIVPPEKVTEDSENWNVFWYIADNGNLKAEVEDPDMLKTVIDGSPNNTIIKLGNISDLKTVEIWGYRKIMLKADREVTLTCPSKGNDYKHLQVQENASLILKGPITLQGADYGSNSQYALFVERGGKAEIKGGVTITGFKNGNIGPVVSDGNLTMSGGEISGNKAKNGGGVYIHAAHRIFTMTGGTIKGNIATEHGGGVYVNADGYYNMYGKFTMTGGKIEGNTADKGGGVFTHGIFTMGKEDGGTGGTITKNTATNDGKAVMLDHHFYWEAGEIKDNLGSGSVIGGNTYYYLHNTSGNTES